MKSVKYLIFGSFFLMINLLLLVLYVPQKGDKLINDPGWQSQYEEMKNVKNGVNYFGLRSQWANHDRLNKKNSDALSFITEMGPNNVAGRVRALLIDAADSLHILVGGVSGGLWATYNGGTTWTPLAEQNLSMAVTCITQNPFNANEIYYGTGEKMNNVIGLDGAGIFKSEDGGKTFNQLSSTASLPAFATIWDIEYSKTDSSTFYVGVDNGGLFRTTNNGESFTVTYPTSKAIQEIITYQDSTIWFGLEAYGLIRATEDTVMNFFRFSNGISTSGIGRISMNYCKKYPNVAFCQMLNTAGTALVGVYKTSNHGLSWKKVTSPSSSTYTFGWYCLNTNVSPIDSNFVTAISVRGMASTNGGTTWTELKASHSDFHSSMFYASGRNMLIGNDGGVHRFNIKTAFTANVSLNNSLNLTQFYTGSYKSSNTLAFMGGTQDNGTHAFNGTSFSKPYGGDGSYCAFSSTSPFYTYVSSQNGEIRRLDQNFTNEVNIKPSGTYSYWFINPFEVNSLDGNQVYILTKTKLLVSTDAGINWNDLTLSLNKTVLTLGLSNELDPTVYFGGSGTTLYRSDKASTSLQKEVDLTATSPTLAKGGVINSIKVNRSNPATIYLAMSDINAKPRVWKLNNAKSAAPVWVNISGNLPVSLAVNCIEVNPQDSNVMVAGSDFGLYTTSDGGINWFKENGVPNVPIFKVITHPKNGTIYIFTHGRGIFKSQFKNYTPTGTITKFANKTLKIYFNNPVESELKLDIEGDNDIEEIGLTLYNPEGKMVYGNIIDNKSSIDISHLTKGIYMMHLIINGTNYNYKVLKI